MPAPPRAVLWAVGRVYGRKYGTEPSSHYRRGTASGSKATGRALVIKVLRQLREPSTAWGWGGAGGTVPTPQGLWSLGLQQLWQQLMPINRARKEVTSLDQESAVGGVWRTRGKEGAMGFPVVGRCGSWGVLCPLQSWHPRSSHTPALSWSCCPGCLQVTYWSRSKHQGRARPRKPLVLMEREKAGRREGRSLRGAEGPLPNCACRSPAGE